jgi:hypothetical protein
MGCGRHRLVPVRASLRRLRKRERGDQVNARSRHGGFLPTAYSAVVAVTVKIKDQSGTGRVGTTTTLQGISSSITLRDLVRTRVRDEVARYNAGPEPVFSGLVMPEGADPVREGFRMPKARRSRPRGRTSSPSACSRARRRVSP